MPYPGAIASNFSIPAFVGGRAVVAPSARGTPPKVFRDSVVENFGEFFDRFRRLNVRSNDQLDELVAQARRVISGIEPQALRENAALRQQVASQMAAVEASLDGLMVDRPRRSIIRPHRPEAT